MGCLHTQRPACTPLTSAALAPQVYFPKGGEGAQPPLNKPIFLKETPCTHLSSLTGQPTCELILTLSGMTCKSQMLEDKDLQGQC